MQTRRQLLLAAAALPTLAGCHPPHAEDDHSAWVARTLKDMLRIRPGMTRSALLRVFTEEGGISTREQQTFVSCDCPYFKVDVTFTPALQTSHTETLHSMHKKDGRDVIASISTPYLGFAVVD